MLTFKEKVYKVVMKIPKGKVLSYKEVAKRAGNEKAARAVGQIMNKHNIKGLPCHRVIASSNEIGGYKWGIEKKIALLKKEGAMKSIKFKNIKVVLIK
jgi:O-6-methylguanine DNA methyltransferase